MAGQYLQGPQSVGEKSVPTYRYVKWPRTGLGALPLDPQRRIEAGLYLQWPTDSEIKLGGEFGFHLREAINLKHLPL